MSTGLKSFLVTLGVFLYMTVMTRVLNVDSEVAMGIILAFGLTWGFAYLVMEFGTDL